MTDELWQQAVGLMDTGRWRAARALLEELLRLQPDHAAAHNKLGVCLAEMGDPVGAELAFRHALQLEPHAPQPLSNLGNIELARGNAAAAVDYYQRALKASPDYAIAHRNLSIAYRKLGQLSKSVAELKKAHSLETRSSQAQGYNAPGESPLRAKPGRWSCLAWILAAVVLIFILMSLR